MSHLESRRNVKRERNVKKRGREEVHTKLLNVVSSKQLGIREELLAVGIKRRGVQPVQ